MTKTDKELTVEIVTNYINSWNNSDRSKLINMPQLLELINDVHKTIQELPEEKD